VQFKFPAAQPPERSCDGRGLAEVRVHKIGQQFKTDNPGSGVDFEFAGSSELATQLTQGATADVFASADTAQMDTVAKAGLLAGDPTSSLQQLVIVTAPGTEKVGSFADLTKPGSTWWFAKSRAVRICYPAHRGQQRRAPQPGQRGTQRVRLLNKSLATGRRAAGLCHGRAQRRNM